MKTFLIIAIPIMIAVVVSGCASERDNPYDPKSSNYQTVLVSFDSQGGTGVASQTVGYKRCTTEPPEPARTGYTFGGWYRECACSTKWMFAHDRVEGNITLYARWLANPCTVAYNSQGGSAVSPETVEYGDLLSVPSSPARTGYTFDAWYREPACVTPWVFPSDTMTGDITLYAGWNINNYTLTYIAGTGGTISGSTTQVVNYGSSGSAVTAVPGTGYHFEQWSDGVVTATRTDTGVTGDLTVTAVFGLTSFTVSFDSQGGSAVSPQMVNYGGFVTEPSVPTRPGYIFAGWYADAGHTDVWVFGSDVVTGDVTLYARWIQVNMISVPAAGVTFPKGYDDAGSATLASSFLIGESEVTYELWKVVYDWAVTHGYSFSNAGVMGDGSGDNDQHPATTINWRDAIVWCNALTEWYNEKCGTSFTCTYYTDAGYTVPLRSSADGSYGSSINPAYGGFDYPYIKAAAGGNISMANCTSTGFRLLTCSEWEFAARWRNNDSTNTVSGFANPYFTRGNSASGATASTSDGTATGLVAWYDANSGGSTHQARTRTPNALGVYDMSGNVWEWCFDWKYAGSERIFNGGHWFGHSGYLPIGSTSGWGNPWWEENGVGFRVARNP